MTQDWAIVVEEGAAASLGGLRGMPGIQVRADNGGIWLRGPRGDEGFEWRLRQVPGARRYEVSADGQFTPVGCLVPRGALPTAGWRPLAEWLRPQLPLAGRPDVRPPSPVGLTLVRSADERPAGLLLTSLAAWSRYAETAPRVRLDRWTFAQDAKGRVLVRGEPLPPLPGVRFVERDGIAVPSGWTWSPDVDPPVLARLLELQANDLALFDAEGHWQRVPGGDWVHAARSAIRRSAEEAAHGD